MVDSEIIKTDLWNEKVAQLFKGTSKSIRPTITPELYKVIHKIKAKFDTTQKPINWVVIKHMSGTFFSVFYFWLSRVFKLIETNFKNLGIKIISHLYILFLIDVNLDFFSKNVYNVLRFHDSLRTTTRK